LLLTAAMVQAPWRRRLQGILALAVAFLVPTVLWMGVLRAKTGNWGLAGSEASTFYAASDPHIQVWDPKMYVPVAASAARRLGVATPTNNQLESEFQRLTLLNYRTFVRYHLRRFLPHLYVIAGISIHDASHVNPTSRRLRFFILAVLGIGLLRPLVRDRRFAAAALVLILLAAWLYRPAYPAVVLIALAGAVPLAIWNKSGWGAAVFVSYWAVGMLALYLVGGTWGAQDGSRVALNALGYRLGCQFFFAADLVVLYFLRNLCDFSLRRRPMQVEGAPISSANGSARWAAFVAIAIVSWLAMTALALGAGAAVVLHRGIERANATARSYPSLAPVLESFRARLGSRSSSDHLRLLAGGKVIAALTPNVDSPYVLTSAASTDFIWNLEGQMRTKVNVAVQSEVSPFQFQPRLFVDFPLTIDERDWTRKQGAWLLRRFADEPLLSALPWYVSDPAIRAFVPLNAARTEFDLSSIQWFRLPKYASQLYHAKELEVEDGKIEFSGASGAERYPRRFAVRPGTDAAGSPAISIDFRKAAGHRDLSFAWQLELVTAGQARRLKMDVETFDGTRKVSDQVRETVATSMLSDLQKVDLDLNQPVSDHVRIEFRGLRPGAAIWLYELNVIADDWDW
jgi:hypothetical protein